MKPTIRYAAAALMLTSPILATAPAAAQDREDAAWKWLDQAMAPTLNQDQRAKLIWAAYNNAAGSLCNEVTVDDAKLGALLAGLLPAAGDKATPEQKHHLEGSLLMHLGAATGIFAAENADNLTEFCTEAATMRDAPEGNSLFLPGEEPEPEKK